jgi:hypothetical protein
LSRSFLFKNFASDEPVGDDQGGVDGAGHAGAGGFKDISDAAAEGWLHGRFSS